MDYGSSLETYLGRPLGVHTVQKVPVAAKRSLRNASGSPSYIWHVQSPPNLQWFDFKNIYRRGNFSENHCSQISFFGIPNTTKITTKILSSSKKLFLQLMRKKVAVAVKKSLRNASGSPNYIRHVQSPPTYNDSTSKKHFLVEFISLEMNCSNFSILGPKTLKNHLKFFGFMKTIIFSFFVKKSGRSYQEKSQKRSRIPKIWLTHLVPPHVQWFDFKNIYSRSNFPENSLFEKLHFLGPKYQKNTFKNFEFMKKIIFSIFAKNIVFRVSKSVSNLFNTLELPPKKFGDDKHQNSRKYLENLFGGVKTRVGGVNFGCLPPTFAVYPPTPEDHVWGYLK